MSLKEIFTTEVRNEFEKQSLHDPKLVSEKDIRHLPEPVQKYFHYCGFVDKPKIINAQVVWRDVFLKLSLSKKWRSIHCFQFNAVPNPARFAFMKSKLAGLIPFEGRDNYQIG